MWQMPVHLTPWLWSKARAGTTGMPLHLIHTLCRTSRHERVGHPDIADSGMVPPLPSAQISRNAVLNISR